MKTVTKKQLQEAIRSIIRRKLGDRLNESAAPATICHGVDGNGNAKAIDAIAEIGMGSDRSSTPTSDTAHKAKFAYFTDATKQSVMLVGYGKISYSALKTKLVDDLSKMHDFAKVEKYDAVVSQWENITRFVAEGLNELDQMIDEVVGGTPDAGETIQVTTNASGKPISQSNQNKINDLEAKKAKAQSLLEKTKGELAKKTKPYAEKINRLEKLLGDTNIAIERIKS